MTLSFWPALLAGAVLASSPAEKRGKQIYLHGTSASGREMTASLGDDAAGLPAASLACAGCHGQDGRGKPEGGIEPPNVTWDSLTKSYGHRHPDGREHPAYTERSIGRAIIMGIDPAGNRLGVAMPKYAMTAQDLTDLVAYLKRIGKERDPGLTGGAIRIGAIVPGGGALGEAGREIEALLTAYFDDVNAHTGIHDRRVELRFLRDEGGPLSSRLERFLEGKGVFALLEARPLGTDREVVDQAEAREIPALVPLAAFPERDAAARRHVFYLLSGLKDQGRALMDFAGAKLDLVNPRVAIVYPQAGSFSDVVEAMEGECKEAGCSSAIKIGYAPGAFGAEKVASALEDDGSQVVCFLGSGEELKSLIEATAAWSPAPTFLVSGTLTGRDVFDTAEQSASRIFVAYPMLPSDPSAQGLEEFRALVRKDRLSLHHLPLQIAAFGAARILVEGLRRAGRDLSREKLVSELEALYEFDSGLLPPVTFGPNRRVGAAGAYVVAVDRARRRFIPVGGWIAAK